MDTFIIQNAARPGERCFARIASGLTLAQHLFMAGAFRDRALCSGAGRCGLCAVRFPEDPPRPLPGEQAVLSGERLDSGFRLACRRRPEPGMLVEVRLPDPVGSLPDLPGPCPDCGPGSRQDCGSRQDHDSRQDHGSGQDRGSGQDGGSRRGSWLGIDLGTTSVQWRCQAGGLVFSGSRPNPQLAAGSEIMSRLAMAACPEGAAALRLAAARTVREILSGLPCLPRGVCLAANTAMTFLALGLDVSGLSAAPYRVDWPGNGTAILDDALPEVYIPPLLAPFAGGDVSAGLAAVAFGPEPPKPPYLLADLGTNGEFALVLPDGRVLLASVPMGPALEGMGMAMGMVAGPGAAVAFQASPAGIRALPWDEGRQARLKGISGTGYVSLVSLLVSMGALDQSGRFRAVGANPLAARALSGLAGSGGEPCLEADGLTLFASDVEALLKVKAAFQAAVGVLLDAAGLSFKDLSRVLLAGALGEHVRPRDLEVLGFFPAGGAARVLAVGNTSLQGACLAAERGDVREWLSELGGRARLVDVVQAADFQKIFINAMRFSHA